MEITLSFHQHSWHSVPHQVLSSSSRVDLRVAPAPLPLLPPWPQLLCLCSPQPSLPCRCSPSSLQEPEGSFYNGSRIMALHFLASFQGAPLNLEQGPGTCCLLSPLPSAAVSSEATLTSHLCVFSFFSRPAIGTCCPSSYMAGPFSSLWLVHPEAILAFCRGFGEKATSLGQGHKTRKSREYGLGRGGRPAHCGPHSGRPFRMQQGRRESLQHRRRAAQLQGCREAGSKSSRQASALPVW